MLKSNSVYENLVLLYSEQVKECKRLDAEYPTENHFYKMGLIEAVTHTANSLGVKPVKMVNDIYDLVEAEELAEQQ